MTTYNPFWTSSDNQRCPPMIEAVLIGITTVGFTAVLGVLGFFWKRLVGQIDMNTKNISNLHGRVLVLEAKNGSFQSVSPSNRR